MEEVIEATLRAHRNVLYKTLNIQFRELITEPFLGVEGYSLNPLQQPIIIIIDGLDECEDHDARGEILELIGNALRTSPSIPLRFIISSRPELDIRDVLGRSDFNDFTHRIHLDYGSGTDKDIRAFLVDAFADIRHAHPALKFAPASEIWPSAADLDLLARQISGQFLYAVTVLKFIDQGYSDPRIKLRQIIHDSDAKALGDIDHLYRRILSQHPDKCRLLDLLGTIIVQRRDPSIGLLANLLDVSPGEINISLHMLHSVLHIPDSPHVDTKFDKGLDFHNGEIQSPFFCPLPDWDGVGVLHKSFTDFLMNRGRSGGLFIDPPVYHARLAHRCMGWVTEAQNNIQLQRWEGVDRLAEIRSMYGVWNWHYHVSRSPLTDTSLIEEIQRFEAGVCLFKSGFSKEAVSEVVEWLKRLPRPPDGLIWRLMHRRSSLMKYILGSWPSEQLQVSGPNVLSFSMWMQKNDWSRALILSAAECVDSSGPQACPSSCGQQDIAAVSRALKNSPEVALGVRMIKSSHFKRGPNEIAFCQAILDVLSRSTLVETIHLRNIHGTLTQQLSDVLYRLANVRDFLISAEGALSPLARVNFSDLLRWVGRWKHLRVLRVHTFDWSITSQQAVFADKSAVAPFGLHELSLTDGVVSAPLLRFLTSSSRSTLVVVCLDGLKGLTNTGLREWLDEISPSIEVLYLSHCVVDRSDDEECALDAVMPKMTLLHHLITIGDMTSASTVERHQSPPRTVVWRNSSYTATDLLAMLQVCPPASFFYTNQVPPLAEKEASRVANERGIHLRYFEYLPEVRPYISVQFSE